MRTLYFLNDRVLQRMKMPFQIDNEKINLK